MHSFGFCLSGKLSPSALNANFAGRVFLVVGFFLSLPLLSGLQSHCWRKFSAGVMEVPLYITSCFALAAFKILSLSLTFDILNMSLVGLFRFILSGTLLASWI